MVVDQIARIRERKFSLTLLSLTLFTCISGCTHLHDGFFHGTYHYPGYYPYYHGHHYGPYYYSPRYASHYSPTYNYDYSVREYLNQNINNSINISGPRYHELSFRQTRSFYIDDTASALSNLQDGTLQQINIVEHQKYSVPLCQTAMQSVHARHYSSFQYTSCN